MVVLFLSIILFKYFNFWGLVFSYALFYVQAYLMNAWYLRGLFSLKDRLMDFRFHKLVLLNILLLVFSYSLSMLTYAHMGSSNIHIILMRVILILILSGGVYYGLSNILKVDIFGMLFSESERE